MWKKVVVTGGSVKVSLNTGYVYSVSSSLLIATFSGAKTGILHIM
jgi:hypothetical protein